MNRTFRESRPEPRVAARRVATLLILALCAPLLSGCVERWLSIHSEPTGARIFLDAVEVGTTPARIPFEHYGTREVLIRYVAADENDENEVLAVARNVELRAPWYQWWIFDLFFEFLWPGTLVDEHVVDVTLPPADYDALEEQLMSGLKLRPEETTESSVDEESPR